MSGNVWEWVSDWYDRDYYKNSPKNNPAGGGLQADKKRFSVAVPGASIRGSWWHRFRLWDVPSTRGNVSGFRVVLSSAVVIFCVLEILFSGLNSPLRKGVVGVVIARSRVTKQSHGRLGGRLGLDIIFDFAIITYQINGEMF